jgi:hypothetical protein
MRELLNEAVERIAAGWGLSRVETSWTAAIDHFCRWRQVGCRQYGEGGGASGGGEFGVIAGCGGRLEEEADRTGGSATPLDGLVLGRESVEEWSQTGGQHRGMAVFFAELEVKMCPAVVIRTLGFRELLQAVLECRPYV